MNDFPPLEVNLFHLLVADALHLASTRMVADGYFPRELDPLEASMLADAAIEAMKATMWTPVSERLPLAPGEVGSGSCMIRCSYGIQAAQYFQDDTEFTWYIGPTEFEIPMSQVYAWAEIPETWFGA